ncbi:recombinase zinc beta ribbon domain-containing protein [Plantactinospora soyae]|uniref:recombinase zinc beta ribbon domain-containing protein n=1 Tax=Plantactinospora soyae TaxID=1544732 RepID=UPI00384AEDAD
MRQTSSSRSRSTPSPAPTTVGLAATCSWGLIRCRLCGRMMDSHWVNNHASYRCRHGNRSSTPTGPGRPRNVYIHEARAIARIAV